MNKQKLASALTLCALTLAAATRVAVARADGPDKAISLAELERVTLTRFPGATIHEVEREEHLGQRSWEVKLRSAKGLVYELQVDLETGNIIGVHEDH